MIVKSLLNGRLNFDLKLYLDHQKILMKICIFIYEAIEIMVSVEMDEIIKEFLKITLLKLSRNLKK